MSCIHHVTLALFFQIKPRKQHVMYLIFKLLKFPQKVSRVVVVSNLICEKQASISYGCLSPTIHALQLSKLFYYIAKSLYFQGKKTHNKFLFNSFYHNTDNQWLLV